MCFVVCEKPVILNINLTVKLEQDLAFVCETDNSVEKWIGLL